MSSESDLAISLKLCSGELFTDLKVRDLDVTLQGYLDLTLKELEVRLEVIKKTERNKTPRCDSKHTFDLK